VEGKSNRLNGFLDGFDALSLGPSANLSRMAADRRPVTTVRLAATWNEVGRVLMRAAQVVIAPARERE
jgi:hypothetical protein